MYAGVVLQKVQNPTEALPPKLTRADLPSDDEVEVVTEWLAPPVLESRNSLLEPPKSPPTSPPLHVPVIQRPVDTAAAAAPQDRDKTVLVGAPPPPTRAAVPLGDSSPHNSTSCRAVVAAVHSVNGSETKKSLKRTLKVDDVYVLDASKEGNVSRFINHSCRPNLFVQNVFTDCHDPAFPAIAFFTSRAVKD
ncbi:histone-lysine N-methyltransferase SETDB2-like, partial [Plectropomus leopardus]|uniref:histone-lysine N-methyltransferase SETDB2-like n=1 Tax=Plectropomus leopardus TaxID=160734 RepID=UPI001C4BEBC1